MKILLVSVVVVCLFNAQAQAQGDSIPNPVNLQDGTSTDQNFRDNNPIDSMTNGFQNGNPLDTNGQPFQPQQPSGGLFSNFFRPLVERAPGYVGVHVPFFVNMDKNLRGTRGESKMDLNVMMGLVKVHRDKVRGPDGRLVGPNQVSVMGIPIFNNGQQAPPAQFSNQGGPNLNGFNGQQAPGQFGNPGGPNLNGLDGISNPLNGFPNTN